MKEDCYLSVAFFGSENYTEKHPAKPFSTAKNACISTICTVKITVFSIIWEIRIAFRLYGGSVSLFRYIFHAIK